MFGSKQHLITAHSCLELVLCSERRSYTLRGKRRGMDRVMTPPGAVIVPEVVIRVDRIKPNG